MEARYMFYSNCPCRCCKTHDECINVPIFKCQKRLNEYSRLHPSVPDKIYLNTKKSRKIYEKLNSDLNDLSKAIMKLAETRCKEENHEMVFLSSRYAYIKELLETFWKE